MSTLRFALSRRIASAVFALLMILVAVPAPVTASTAGGPQIAYSFKLFDGRTATVDIHGLALIVGKDRRTVERRFLRSADMQSKQRALFALTRPPQPHPFVNGRLIVAFSAGVAASADVQQVGKKQLAQIHAAALSHKPFVAPQYTSDAQINRVLGVMGTARMERLFRHVTRGQLATLHSRAEFTVHHSLVDFSNTYRLDVAHDSIPHAVAALKKIPGVQYVSADWSVSPLHADAVPLPSASIDRASQMTYEQRKTMATVTTATLPTNFAVTSSAQSLLNASDNNAIAAFDEIGKAFGQLPGQGEIITNVSIGDIDDAAAANDEFSDCGATVNSYGPTTVLINGQHYIDWPSMPLIPAYTADTAGNLSGSSDVCDVDPFMAEIGLDFSMMAPLPHNLQRSGRVGVGFEDLLGIAPGAQYRLVVPASFNPGMSDIDGALLGAALQQPSPTVITASLGFGVDVTGFPSRFLEDDPLSQAIIAGIVSTYGTIVCISAGDGTRLYTPVAIGTTGGSVATNVAASSADVTNLNDVAFSTTPSNDVDSGSIDVGGTTLDDILSVEPHDPSNASLRNQHEFPETRWNGFTAFSSGFGTRVNVAAPSDNVVSFIHYGGTASSVYPVLNGGTSASAPEVAAAAAIVHQVTRLTGHPMSALQVRDFLEKTGSPIPQAAQADSTLSMGTALNIGDAVETLLAQAGHAVTPAVPRVAVEQRQPFASGGDTYYDTWEGDFDLAYETDTNPANINLQGPQSILIGGGNTDENQNAWITIAPDWEGVGRNAQYKLYVANNPSKVLATTPYARLLPKDILGAVGLPLVSSTARTVNLTYVATLGGNARSAMNRTLGSRTTATLSAGASRRVSASFSLTFGPDDSTFRGGPAPIVPAVVASTSIPVTYDLTGVRDVKNPVLIVSSPGRVNPADYGMFHPIYMQALVGLKGTANIPVSALQGGGVYGIGIKSGTIIGSVPLPGGGVLSNVPVDEFTDFAYTRVQASASAARPSAPTLSISGGPAAHSLEVPYNADFQVSYNVGSVPGATGVILEISAGGPGAWSIFNPFNNPNGTIADRNGVDTGSVYTQRISGTNGTVTLNGLTAGLLPSLYHDVRVIPVGSSGAVGEASDVSSIIMDGVNPQDGGAISGGFGLDPSGKYGVVVTNWFIGGLLGSDPFGTPFADAQMFDQSTNQLTTGLFGEGPHDWSSNSYQQMYTFGFGILNHSALLNIFNPGLQSSGFANGLSALFDPSTGYIQSLWTPQVSPDVPYPANPLALFMQAAPNSSTSTSLFAEYSANDGNSYVLKSDLASGTMGPLFDVSAPTQSLPGSVYTAIAQNTVTNEALLPFGTRGQQAQFTRLDTTTGKISVVPISGFGFPTGLALDSQTDKAAIPTVDDAFITFYNLNTNTETSTQLPYEIFPHDRSNGIDYRMYWSGVYPTSDSTNGLFLVAQPVSADVLTNHNSLSTIWVYDENGRVVKSMEQFNLLWTSGRSGLQLIPGTRSGWVIGTFGQQLVPFKY